MSRTRKSAVVVWLCCLAVRDVNTQNNTDAKSIGDVSHAPSSAPKDLKDGVHGAQVVAASPPFTASLAPSVEPDCIKPDCTSSPVALSGLSAVEFCRFVASTLSTACHTMRALPPPPCPHSGSINAQDRRRTRGVRAKRHLCVVFPKIRHHPHREHQHGVPPFARRVTIDHLRPCSAYTSLGRLILQRTLPQCHFVRRFATPCVHSVICRRPRSHLRPMPARRWPVEASPSVTTARCTR